MAASNPLIDDPTGDAQKGVDPPVTGTVTGAAVPNSSTTPTVSAATATAAAASVGAQVAGAAAAALDIIGPSVQRALPWLLAIGAAWLLLPTILKQAKKAR